MNEFRIILSEETNKDIHDLFDFIELNIKAPLTAKVIFSDYFQPLICFHILQILIQYKITDPF